MIWKTITLWRPWPTMIALGHKPIEYRTHDRFAWLVGHQIAIHAGQRYDDEALEYLLDGGYNVIQSLLIESACPKGVVVAVCQVWQAKWIESSDGLFGLFLRDVRALIEPVPARGKQGVWPWTPPEGWSIEMHTTAVVNRE